jgi:hypothetical protein
MRTASGADFRKPATEPAINENGVFIAPFCVRRETNAGIIAAFAGSAMNRDRPALASPDPAL